MSRRRRSPARLGPRRGVTLVIVAISLIVFIGFAALAIDLARLTNFKGELKGIADAAAASAALDLASARTLAQATTNVTTLVGRNPIAGTATATVQEVSAVQWNFDSSRVDATSAWNAANAVRVVAQYPMSWALSQVFGQGTGRTLVDTSIAAIGQRLTHDCLRPIALPYSALRTQLGLANVTDTASLTAANIYALRALTTATAYTVLDTVNAAAFGWVNTRQGTTANATNVASALGSCLSGTLGAGSTLSAVPKAGDSTNVQTAATTLCGSATSCSLAPRIMVPVFTSGSNTGAGGTTTTTTNQTYDFTLTGISNGCRNGLNSSGASAFFTLSQCSTDAARVPTVPATFTSGSSTYNCTGTRTVQSFSSSTSTIVIRFASCTVTTTTGGSGRAASTYVIKYIATFVWTARTNTTITGYFTTINLPPAGSGTWSGTPGPVTSVVLVR